MRAMILAAGRGERMRPLTDNCPKPLLPVADKPLLVYHLEKLRDIGITDIVINHAWLGNKIVEFLGDGAEFGVNIQYSAEPDGALETAGGIIKALPLLGKAIDSDESFIVVNGDIWTDYDFSLLPTSLDQSLAHLVFVDNPEHNLEGDFAVIENKVCQSGTPKYTFSGIAVYHPKLFAGEQPVKAPVPPIWRRFMDEGLISGEIYHGLWTDVGTPQRLAQLEQQIAQG